jgi:hypothetical protein
MDAMHAWTRFGPAVGPTHRAWADGEPIRIFADPREVLEADLAQEEKRALLAHWASDACAVESAPALRRCPGLPGRTVPVDDVLAALQALDRLQPTQRGAAELKRRGHRVLWTAERGASAWRRQDPTVMPARRLSSRARDAHCPDERHRQGVGDEAIDERGRPPRGGTLSGSRALSWRPPAERR